MEYVSAQKSHEEESYFRWMAFVFLMLFPLGSISLHIVHGLVNLVIGFSGVYLIARRINKYPLVTNEDRLFIYSVFSLVLVVFAVTAIHGMDEVAVKKLGKFFYLLFTVPVFLFFRIIGVSQAAFWYGLIGGAIFSVFQAFYDLAFELFKHHDIGRAQGVSHPIIFGDISLLIGAMALIGVGWFNKQAGRWKVLLPVMAALMGLVSSFLSQARGAWLAIPIVVFILIWFYGRRVAKWKLGLSVLLLIIASCVIYNIPQSGVAEKIERTTENLQKYMTADVSSEYRGTSLGSRLEMWQASLQIFYKNPILGVGWGNYQEEAQLLVDHGLRHPSAAAYSHPHNQFLSSMVSGGIVGLGVTLVLFMVPSVKFYRVIKSSWQSDDAKRMALVGLILIVSFVIFNLTESFLERSRTVGFFVFYLAACMAAIRNDGDVGNLARVGSGTFCGCVK